MFEWSKELCKKISNSDCLSKNELQMVEIALRLYECYEEALNENLGLDIIAKRETNLFQLEHAINRNSLKEKE